jgi:hypothetical protein
MGREQMAESEAAARLSWQPLSHAFNTAQASKPNSEDQLVFLATFFVHLTRPVIIVLTTHPKGLLSALMLVPHHCHHGSSDVLFFVTLIAFIN